MKKSCLFTGNDFTDLLPMFTDLIIRAGAKEQDNLIFAGCPGPCFSMATFFGFGIRDLNLHLYFAANGDLNRLWRLQYNEATGMAASGKATPVKAEVLVLMSGLCTLPLEQTLKLIEGGLSEGGRIIGEAPAFDLFEEQGWADKVPFDFLFEFAMERPTAFEVADISD
ncbi:MAG: DUF2124 family protein [Pseudomonadota bacterium]